jgi:hypothetical protein
MHRLPRLGSLLRSSCIALILAIPTLASADELWVLPSDSGTDVGSWYTTGSATAGFTAAIPDDFDSLSGATLLAIGSDKGGSGTAEITVHLSVSAEGLDHADYTDSATFTVALADGELTAIDLTSLLDLAYAPGSDYVAVSVSGSAGNSDHLQLVGLRLQYQSTDTDADPTNELNTAFQLDGTVLELTDAGGTLSADLAILEDSAEVLSEQIRAEAAEAALQGAIDAHVSADADLDAGNELNGTLGLSGTTLQLTDAGGTLAADLASLDESADVLAEELRALAAEAGLAADIANVSGALASHVSADGDLSASNELQSLSRSGTTVTLSSGGSVSIADNDNDPSNELQALSLSGTTLSLSSGGSVSLASLGADNLGDHNATTTIDTNGHDIDFERGDVSQVHSLGRISFDWTSGIYDDSSYHGIESEDEWGSMADSLRVNSYNDVVVTLDSNDNNAVSYFVVQHHSTGNGSDLFWVDQTGRVWGRHESLTSGTATGYDDDGTQICPGNRVAYGFDADDFSGMIDQLRLRCAYVQ